MKKIAGIVLLASVLLIGCRVRVTVSTPPMTLTVGMTGIATGLVGNSMYGETCMEVPRETYGAVIDYANATFHLVNPTKGTTMRITCYLSLEGSAAPGQTIIYSELSKPPYLSDPDISQAILNEHSIPPGADELMVLSSNDYVILKNMLQQERFWIIAKNTVETGGMLDQNPEVNIKDLVVDVRAEKETDSFAALINLLF